MPGSEQKTDVVDEEDDLLAVLRGIAITGVEANGDALGPLPVSRANIAIQRAIGEIERLRSLGTADLVQATVEPAANDGSVIGARCQWLPIETAPKGKKVIVRATGDFRGERTMMARFHPKHTLEAPEGYGASDGFDEDEHGDVYAPEDWYEDMEASEAPLHNIVPTHWLPLPVAPKMETKR